VPVDREQWRRRLRTDLPARRSTNLDGGAPSRSPTGGRRPEQENRIAGEGGSTGTFSGGRNGRLGSPPTVGSEYSAPVVLWAKEAAAGEESGVECPSM
jgi:hypothetical protein